MECSRRHSLFGVIALALSQTQLSSMANSNMFGMIGKITVVPGQRDAFIGILLSGTQQMPGCLNYLVCKDAADENAVWITEAWDSKTHHDASLALPSVKEAIAKGKPMIAKFETVALTEPVGGVGLPVG
jgi:quinol monooxygenase YgiN